jgi:hypothetical protein
MLGGWHDGDGMKAGWQDAAMNRFTPFHSRRDLSTNAHIHTAMLADSTEGANFDKKR